MNNGTKRRSIPPIGIPKQDCNDDANWLAIYGDMMSLLLVFFILMLAISDINEEKFETVMSAISDSMGGHRETRIIYVKVDPKDAIMEQISDEQAKLDVMNDKISNFVAENNLHDQVTVEDKNDGLHIRVEGDSIFGSGSAEIREEMRANLIKIGDIIFPLDNEIVIEGHTDNVPIKTRKFASNWELSTARATNIVHFFSQRLPVTASRLSAAGYAYYRPLYPFDSADNGKNRRIEIFVRKQFTTDLANQISEL